MAACDFFTTEVWTLGGLITFYVFFVMEIATRRVQIAGITTSPNSTWMKQVARNLTDCQDGFLKGKLHLIMDRDGSFTEEFREILKTAGVKPVRLPPQSPNLNAFAERWVRSIKSECLERMIFFGEKMFRDAISEFVATITPSATTKGSKTRSSSQMTRSAGPAARLSAANVSVDCSNTTTDERRSEPSPSHVLARCCAPITFDSFWNSVKHLLRFANHPVECCLDRTSRQPTSKITEQTLG